MADLATLAPEEFEAKLREWTGGNSPSATPQGDSPEAFPIQPAPDDSGMADWQMAPFVGSQNYSFLQEQPPVTAAEGARPGVPFNTDRGAPALTRAALSFDQDRLNQFKLLAGKYGPNNVEISPDNQQFVIRNQKNPETGAIEDFHVNPMGFEPADVAGVAADIIPITAGVLGAVAGGMMSTRPLVKFGAGLVGGALATEGAAAQQTILSRLIAGNDIKPGEIAYERSKAAVADMTVGAVLAGGTKIATKAAQSLLGLVGVSTGDTATTLAAKKLKSKTGVDYALTPGEAAESTLLMRAEATAKPSIGSVGVMGQVEKAKSEAENELRRVFLGLPRTMTDEQVAAALPKADRTGQKILGELGKETTRLEGNVATAKQTAEFMGTAEAQTVARVNLAAPLEPTAVGSQLRAKAVGDFDTFKSEMGERYNEFLSRPEIRARTINANNLVGQVKRLENEMVPSAQRGVIKESLEAFVPAKFRGFVNELKGLKGAKVSVNDLKQVRTAIDNAISEGIAIPGTDTAQLKGLRDVVESSITTALEGMDRLPSAYAETAPLTIWNNLKKDYAEGMSRFNRMGIRQMLVKEGESGSIANAKLARSVASGSDESLDRYNDFKTFFGPTSPEFRNIQRLAREQVLEGSLGETTGFVNGQTLRSKLRGLDNEVAKDLFGIDRQELHKIGEALAAVQGNLDQGELMRLAGNGTLTASAIPGLVRAERARATAWSNKLIRAGAKGEAIDAETIKASDVVRNITQLDPADAGRVLGLLQSQPALTEEVRKLAVEDLWSRVQSQLKSRQGVTSSLIEETLGDDTQKRTWKLLLGNDVVSNLETLSKIVKPQELATREFRSAGSFRATGDISKAEAGGIFEVAKTAAERMLIATLYTGPLRQSLVNLATPINQGRLLNSIIASAPFIERVSEKFGDQSPEIMRALRGMVEPQQQRQLQLQGKVQGQPLDLRTLSPAEFEQWLKNAKQ